MWNSFCGGFVAAAFCIAVSLWGVAWLNGGFLILPIFTGPPVPEPGLEYKDLVAILLTALGVMIAILALVLAAAAIWGYGQIKEEAARKAEAVAREISPKVAREAAEEALRRDLDGLVEVALSRREQAKSEAAMLKGIMDYGKAAGKV